MAQSHQPRKRFGQNFLHDPGVIDRIRRAIAPQPGQRLVEIGPGQGALTHALLPHVDQLHVIELDRDLVPGLMELSKRHQGKITVHQADALKFDFTSLAIAEEAPLRVVGNLPYNISTPLLFHLFEQAEHIVDMHFMLQKEVVDRMAAAPGSKTYGRLSVMTQLFSQCASLFEVGPGAFNPPPKVRSAVVRLIPRTQEERPDRNTQDALDLLVNRAFSARRKTLHNAWKGLISNTDMEKQGIRPEQRAETVAPTQYLQLAQEYLAQS